MEGKELQRFMHCSVEANQNDQLNLLHLGWEKCRPGYAFVNHRDLYLLHYIKSGKGVLETNGSFCKLSGGEAFLLRPNQMAIYTADKTDPWEYYYFAFNGSSSHYLLEKTVFANGQICAKINNDELVERIISATFEVQKRNDLYFWSLEQLFGFLNILYSDAMDKKDVKLKRNQLVSSIEEYILFNYSKPIQISALSKIFGFNRSHLHRIFKSHTGKNIADFIIFIRMQEAKRFFRDTNLSVTEIAKLVGYNNYSSFFRAFKTLEGITPTEYRNENKRQNLK